MPGTRFIKLESVTIKEEPLDISDVQLLDPTLKNKPPKQKKFRCEVCLASFKKKSVCDTHMTNHTISPDEERKFPCGVCGNRLLEIESITIKEEQLDISDVQVSDPTPKNQPPKQKKFRCEVCMASFKKKSVYDTHMTNHTRQNKYECTQCPAVFYKKKLAEEHRKEHRDFKATGVTCTACQVWCKSTKSLYHHSKSHSTGPGKRIYTCNLCGAPFPTTLDLKDHKGQHHPLERRHICEFCGQGFQFVNHLTTHMISHDEERKFPCGVCGNRFKRKEHLNAHLRMHEKEQERGLRTYQT